MACIPPWQFFRPTRVEILKYSGSVPMTESKLTWYSGQVSRSAVFLPQVAPEQGWDLAETLTNLSRKAGLPPDAWKSPAAKFTVFEAIVFRESDFRETGR